MGVLRPPRLRPGARVALIAPAGPVSEQRIAAALARVAALGLEPVLGSAVRERRGYLAGTDERRARDLRHALEDRSIDAVWALRGGYGTMRLLGALDAARLRDSPRAFIGFSDNTALHVAIGRAGIVSFHGPHAGGAWTAVAEATFRRVLFDAKPAGELPLPCRESATDRQRVAAVTSAGLGRNAVPLPEAEPRTGGNADGERDIGAERPEQPRTLTSGVAEGELAGGNLSLLAALCGTPFALHARDRIIVLEDVGEATYRIDRSLTQLLLSGCLDGAAGLALGRFTERPAKTDDRRLEDVLGELAATLGVPAAVGFPIGHASDNWCLPLRVRARLDADRHELSLLEPAVT